MCVPKYAESDLIVVVNASTSAIVVSVEDVPMFHLTN